MTKALQKFRCHKVVEAFQIESCTESPDLSKQTLIGTKGEEATVSQSYMSRHFPKKGGYFVQYPDGYQSYSPREAFESGYSPLADGLAPSGNEGA